jgi:hypothetical protein
MAMPRARPFDVPRAAAPQNFVDLYRNYIVAREASAKDDLVDANNDGIADVNQIPKSEVRSDSLRACTCHEASCVC